MLRQTYEVRANRNIVEKQLEFRHIVSREELDYTETSFGGNCRLTQKQFENYMKQADTVAKKWR